MTPLRIATWNLSQRTEQAAGRLGAVLARHGGADVVLLQEVSKGGIEPFCEAAGLEWWAHVGHDFGDLLWLRGRSGGHNRYGEKRQGARQVAIAGRGKPIRGVTPFPDLPLPEKVLAGWIDIDGQATTVVSYHAPTGAQHKVLKPIQAVRIASWLATLDGPVIFGGDFNTPLLDPPDDDLVRTHYWTGSGDLGGLVGDDALVGTRPFHPLREAMRSYLAARPDELEVIRSERPDGPLAISYRTGDQDQHRYRFDQIWLTPDFEVQSVRYLYDEAIAAGTDHALVLIEATTEVGR